jgi:repressor LexA
MSTLTRRQTEILGFIEMFIDENHFSPTYDEIANGCGLASISTVHKHITNLEALGRIKRVPNRAQSIEIVRELPTDERFTFVNPDRLWDSVDECFWRRERK